MYFLKFSWVKYDFWISPGDSHVFCNYLHIVHVRPGPLTDVRDLHLNCLQSAKWGDYLIRMPVAGFLSYIFFGRKTDR